MKVLLLFLTCLFFTISSISQQRVLLKFKPTVNYQMNNAGSSILVNSNTDNIFTQNNLIKVNAIIPASSVVNNALKSIEKLKDVHFAEFNSTLSLPQLINNLKATNLFEYVEEDFIGNGAGVRAITPNDTYFNRQWGLFNNGTFNGSAVAGADIRMKDAWSITTGSPNTIVCVLDAGIKFDHPDFAGRIWTNPSEIASNGIDDDGNGYVDDVNGWDWANNDNNATDDHGHGTNVAGIIAANGNNNLGYAGVDWNCKIMPGKIINSSNSGFYSWWISGIYYAVAKGAKVINMSVGGSGFSQPMKDACDFAFNNNVTIVACMMNTNNNVTHYPVGYESTIGVGATDVNDRRVSPFFWGGGSNYGSHIEIVAPGNYIYGLAYNSNTNYDTYWGGTSQATPLITGIVSLLYSINPNLTAAQVKSIIISSGQDMVGSALEDVAGFDNYMGYGRINALTAVTNSILPINFGKLSGQKVTNGILLLWNTYQIIDIAKFEIEYSKNTTSWNKVGEITSIRNSNVQQQFSYIHNSVWNDVNYYRIKIVENSGSVAYSNICRVNKGIESDFKITQNPATTQLQVEGYVENDAPLLYTIFNMKGNALLKQTLFGKKGINAFTIPITEIANGRYFIKITNSKTKEEWVGNFVKQ